MNTKPIPSLLMIAAGLLAACTNETEIPLDNAESIELASSEVVVANPTSNLNMQFSSMKMNLGALDTFSIPSFDAHGSIDSYGNVQVDTMNIPVVQDTITSGNTSIGVTYVTEIVDLPYGALDPSNGKVNASMEVIVHVKSANQKIQYCTVGPLAWDLTSGTSGSKTGIPYDQISGTTKVVDNEFVVPAIVCNRAALTLIPGVSNESINESIGFPASAGESFVEANISLSPAPQSAVLYESEPNDNTSSANGIGSYVRTIRGSMSSSAAPDWFKIQVPAGKTITLSHSRTTTTHYDEDLETVTTTYSTGPALSLYVKSSSGSTLATGSSSSSSSTKYDDPDCNNQSHLEDCDSLSSTTTTSVITSLTWKNTGTSTVTVYPETIFKTGGSNSGSYSLSLTQ